MKTDPSHYIQLTGQLAGSECEECRIKFPAEMKLCEMGYFHLVGAWPEQIGDKAITFRLDLELVEAFESSWWMFPTTTNSPSLKPAQPLSRDLCNNCRKQSMVPYYNTFSICVNEACTARGTNQGLPPKDQSLAFRQEYIAHSQLPAGLPKVSFSTPSYADLVADISMSLDSEKYALLQRAVVCPNDFEILYRGSWHGWTCPTCNFTLHVPHPQNLLFDLIKHQADKGFCEVRVLFPWNLLISRTEELDKNGYNETRLSIDGQREVVVACPRPGKNQEAGGADAMWQEIVQTGNKGELSLERGTMGRSKVGGQLIGYYSASAGEAYDHKAIVPDRNFEEMSPVYRTLQAKLQARKDQIYPETANQAINEVMVCMYRPKQKMNFHVDTLTTGPIISWCLGSKETFDLAVRTEHFYRLVKVEHEDGECPFGAGTWHWCQWHILAQKIVSAQEGAKTDLRQQQEALDSAKLPNKRPNPPTAITIIGTHGCFITMNGHDIQTRFWHRVTPDGYRAGITGRTVDVQERNKKRAEKAAQAAKGKTKDLKRPFPGHEDSDDGEVEVDGNGDEVFPL